MFSIKHTEPNRQKSNSISDSSNNQQQQEALIPLPLDNVWEKRKEERQSTEREKQANFQQVLRRKKN